MEKNIAALMRQDARTVHVSYNVDIDEENQPKYVQKATSSPAMDLKAYGDQFQRPPSKSVPFRQKTYTYVTDLPLKDGDLVIVDAAGAMKLATVAHIDDVVDIEPNSNIAYKWVVAKVDLTHYEQCMAKNKLITDAVADAYKSNLRRSFAQQILGGMPEEQRLALEKLTNG